MHDETTPLAQSGVSGAAQDAVAGSPQPEPQVRRSRSARRPGTINFTDRWIRALKPPSSGQMEYADEDSEGLHIRITRFGTRSWSVVVQQRTSRGTARRRRFTIGRYPQMSLDQAREETRAKRDSYAKGADPINERRKARATSGATGVQTVKDLLTAYEEIQIAERKREGYGRYWPKARKGLERELKRLLPTDASALSAGDIQQMLDRVKRTAPVSARSHWESLRPLLLWAERLGYVPKGIVESVVPPSARVRKQRDHVLSHEDIKAVWPVLEDWGNYGAIYKLLVLLARRRSEVAFMEWREVKLDTATWTIPAGRSKTNKEVVVPLNESAAAMLGKIRERAKDKHGLVFQTPEGKAHMSWSGVHQRILKTSKTTGWTRHDLRRTAATGMLRIGIDPHVVAHVLGHADPMARVGLGSVASTYMRHNYEPEVRAALQKWDAELADIVAAGSKVVPLAKASGRR